MSALVPLPASKLAGALEGDEEVSSSEARARHMLSDSDWRLRTGAAEAIGRRGAMAAALAPALVPLLADPVAVVRTTAERALEQMGTRAAPAVADAVCGDAGFQRGHCERLLLNMTGGDSFHAAHLLEAASARQVDVSSYGSRNAALELSTKGSKKGSGNGAAGHPSSDIKGKVDDVSLPLVSQKPVVSPEERLASPTQVSSREISCQNRPASVSLWLGKSSLPRTSVNSQLSCVDSFLPSYRARYVPMVPSSPVSSHGSMRKPPRKSRARQNLRISLPFSPQGASHRSATNATLHTSPVIPCIVVDDHLSLKLQALAPPRNIEIGACLENVVAELDDTDQGQTVLESAAGLRAGTFREHTALARVEFVEAACLGRVQESDSYVRELETPGRLDSFCVAACEDLRSQSGDVRAAAKKSLLTLSGNHTQRDRQSTKSEADGGSENIARELDRIRAHVSPVLDDPNSEVRKVASEVLVFFESLAGGSHARCANLAVDCRAALLEDTVEEVRLRAVEELGSLGRITSERAGDLAGRLADSSEAVRRAAVHAFQLLDETGAFAVPRIQELLAHPLQTVRRAAFGALEALGEPAEPGKTQRYVSMLQDTSAVVRCNAIETLAERCAGDDGATLVVDRLAELHIDQHWAVRLAVASGLDSFGVEACERHTKELNVLRLDSDWRVRRAATRACGREHGRG